MSYKYDDKVLKVAFYSTNSQFFEIPKSILIFVMCIYIDVRNTFDKNNELLF
jgi:hypothetical protein